MSISALAISDIPSNRRKHPEQQASIMSISALAFSPQEQTSQATGEHHKHQRPGLFQTSRATGEHHEHQLPEFQTSRATGENHEHQRPGLFRHPEPQAQTSRATGEHHKHQQPAFFRHPEPQASIMSISGLAFLDIPRRRRAS